MFLNEARVLNGLDPKEGLNVPGTVAQAVQWKQSELKGDIDYQSQLQHSKDYDKAPGDNKSPLPSPSESNQDSVDQEDNNNTTE